MWYTKPIHSLIILTVFLFCSLSHSAGFEGKIVNRDISLPVYAFPSLNEIEDMDSDAFQSAVQKLFEKSPDELIQIARSNGGGDDIQESISTIYIKGDKYRIDSEEEGEKQSIIYDIGTKSINMIQWESKMVITASLDEFKEGFSEMLPTPPGTEMPEMTEDNSKFSMKTTGKTRTINGYTCELYTGTNQDGDYTNLWLTSGNQDLFEAFKNMMTVMEESFAKGKLLDEEDNFFLEKKGVDMLNLTASSFDINIQEMKDITAQTLSADFFEVPQNFQKISPQEMMEKEMDIYRDQN
jgi:hypothetical protein